MKRKAHFDLPFCLVLSAGGCDCVLKQGPLRTMPPPSDIVKVAIEWPGANAQLLEIDQVCQSSKEGSGAQRRKCLGPQATGIISKGSDRKPLRWAGPPQGRCSLWLGKGFFSSETEWFCWQQTAC